MARAREFFLLENTQTGCVNPLVSCVVGTLGSRGRGVKHSHTLPSDAEVKHACSYISKARAFTTCTVTLYCARFEVLTAVLLKMPALWYVVVSCQLLNEKLPKFRSFLVPSYSESRRPKRCESLNFSLFFVLCVVKVVIDIICGVETDFRLAR